MKKLKCKICNKLFKHLGSHLWHKHKVLSKDYKMEFGLDINTALVTSDISDKQKEHSRKWKTYEGNFKGSKKYQFKPGARYKSQYISPITRKRMLINLVKMNKKKKEHCLVCNIIFSAVDSHLFNKHKLLRVK